MNIKIIPETVREIFEISSHAGLAALGLEGLILKLPSAIAEVQLFVFLFDFLGGCIGCKRFKVLAVRGIIKRPVPYAFGALIQILQGREPRYECFEGRLLELQFTAVPGAKCEFTVG